MSPQIPCSVDRLLSGGVEYVQVLEVKAHGQVVATLTVVDKNGSINSLHLIHDGGLLFEGIYCCGSIICQVYVYSIIYPQDIF